MQVTRSLLCAKQDYIPVFGLARVEEALVAVAGARGSDGEITINIHVCHSRGFVFPVCFVVLDNAETVCP